MAFSLRAWSAESTRSMSVSRGGAVHDGRSQLQLAGLVAPEGVRRRLLAHLLALGVQVGPAHLRDGDARGGPAQAHDVRARVGDAHLVVLGLGARKELLQL